MNVVMSVLTLYHAAYKQPCRTPHSEYILFCVSLGLKGGLCSLWETIGLIRSLQK